MQSRLRMFSRLRRVDALFDASLPEPIHRAEAARAATMTPEALSRKFRQATGVTFEQWLELRRCAEALAILREQDCPQDVLASRSGFGSESTLRRAFRKVFGRTPREVRLWLLRGLGEEEVTK